MELSQIPSMNMEDPTAQTCKSRQVAGHFLQGNTVDVHRTALILVHIL